MAASEPAQSTRGTGSDILLWAVAARVLCSDGVCLALFHEAERP